MDTPLEIAVCEDDPKELALLLRLISQSNQNTKCSPFSCGEGLLESFVPGCYDLILLDIYLENMSGIEAATRIRSYDPDVVLAFTTSSSEHALEGYRLKASAYLEKPLQLEQIRDVLDFARERRKNRPSIQVITDGRHSDIPLDNVLYFEGQSRAVSVVTFHGRFLTTKNATLKNIAPILPSHFLRCHHGFIVNLRHIKGVDRVLKLFIMSNGDLVYIRNPSFKSAVTAYEETLITKAKKDNHVGI